MSKAIDQSFLEPQLLDRSEVQGNFTITIDEYHRMIKAGILNENHKVELLFGHLIPIMPVSELHAETVSLLFEFFYDKFGKQYKYRGQDPVTLPYNSEPEPDFAIVTRKRYPSGGGHPGAEDTHLIIEVANTTIKYDRGSKARSYALSGMVEYWIINIAENQVEVHLQPNLSNGEYQSINRYQRGMTFESPFVGLVQVNDVLTPEE